MWNFTPEFCKEIPIEKSNKVVCTLTSGMSKRKYDIELIEMLLENYQAVYYWIQGYKDYDYIRELGYDSKMNIIIVIYMNILIF